MLSKVYNPLVTMTAVLLSFGTAVALAHAGGLPSPATSDLRKPPSQPGAAGEVLRFRA